MWKHNKLKKCQNINTILVDGVATSQIRRYLNTIKEK